MDSAPLASNVPDGENERWSQCSDLLQVHSDRDCDRLHSCIFPDMPQKKMLACAWQDWAGNQEAAKGRQAQNWSDRAHSRNWTNGWTRAEVKTGVNSDIFPKRR